MAIICLWFAHGGGGGLVGRMYCAWKEETCRLIGSNPTSSRRRSRRADGGNEIVVSEWVEVNKPNCAGKLFSCFSSSGNGNNIIEEDEPRATSRP